MESFYDLLHKCHAKDTQITLSKVEGLTDFHDNKKVICLSALFSYEGSNVIDVGQNNYTDSSDMCGTDCQTAAMGKKSTY